MSTLRLSGLMSNMDTESIVKQLMDAQELKKTKLVNKQTVLTWQQDKWKDLNTKLYALYTGGLSKMKTQGSYQTKTATSSDTSAVSVTAGNNAATGTQKVEVSSLASAQYVTSGDIGIKSTTTLASLGLTVDPNNKIAVTNSKTGVTKELVIDTTTKISDVLTTLKDAGLNATFDETNERFTIGTSGIGVDQTFSIGGNATELAKLGLGNITTTGTSDNTSVTVTKASATSGQYVTGKKIGVTSATTLASLGIADDININGAVVKNDATVGSFLSACKNAGLNASFDETQNRFFISSKTSGASQKFSIGGNNTDLAKLGLGTTDGTSATDVTTGMTVVAASDATIKLNGATFTSSSNTINANGLTITANAKTTGEVSINTTNNTQDAYDMVKKFVTSYNAILDEMNKLYYASSAKGYDPLTDEQKEAMTDDQITKWEDKIKGSMLRRDSKMGSILNTMKTTMSGTYTDKTTGKSYSLATFGIATSTDYSEKGLLHIYGNSEDSVYSANEDKLKAALEKDPDTVMKTLSSIAGNLYDSMTKTMKSTSLNSAMTFYNDKEMTRTQTTYKTQISNFESKLQKMEDSYYKKFTAMETAMAKLQSQSSQLSSMLGN